MMEVEEERTSAENFREISGMAGKLLDVEKRSARAAGAFHSEGCLSEIERLVADPRHPARHCAAGR